METISFFLFRYFSRHREITHEQFSRLIDFLLEIMVTILEPLPVTTPTPSSPLPPQHMLTRTESVAGKFSGSCSDDSLAEAETTLTMGVSAAKPRRLELLRGA